MELKDILKKLVVSESIKDGNQILSDLKKLYGGDYRHKHSEIATFIASQEDTESAVMNLAQNFKTLEGHLGGNDKDFQRNIERLSDHINLECVHWENLGTKKEFREVKKGIGSAQSELKTLQNQTTNLQNQTTNLQNQATNLKNQATNLQNQYVTVLGIFASIVLTLVTGLVFSTSVLSSIHQATSARVAFTIFCIAFLFFNLIYILMYFILRVLDRDTKDHKCCLIVVDVVLALLIVGSLSYCVFFDKTSKETQSKVSNSTINNNVVCPQQTIPKSPLSNNEGKNARQQIQKTNQN